MRTKYDLMSTQNSVLRTFAVEFCTTTKHLKMQLSPVDEFCFYLFPVISWELLVERRFPVAFCTRIAKRTIRRVFDALVAAADASVMS